MENPRKVPVVRDKAFAKRLDTAMLDHPRAPEAHGRQKWLREQLETRFSVTITPEAVRKYFAGETRPRPKLMAQLAQILEVDEAWLSLGLSPASRQVDKRRHNAMAQGAVNVVAGMIQMAGGTIAFPTADNPNADLFAIVQGVQTEIEVKVMPVEASHAVRILPDYQRRILIVLAATKQANAFAFIRVPSDVIEQYGDNRGGHIELSIKATGSTYSVGSTPLPVIVDFANLEGEMPGRSGRKSDETLRDAARRALDLEE